MLKKVTAQLAEQESTLYQPQFVTALVGSSKFKQPKNAPSTLIQDATRNPESYDCLEFEHVRLPGEHNILLTKLLRASAIMFRLFSSSAVKS